MRHWWVYSPEWLVVIDVGLECGSGPTEPYCEAVCVAASNKRAAAVAGLKLMKEWPTQARGDNQSPFTGLKVEPALCPHGVCTCDLEGCPEAAETCDHCCPPEPELDVREVTG